MATPVRATNEQIKTAIKSLRAALDFLEAELPPRLKNENKKRLVRARRILIIEEFDTSEKLHGLADALLWSIDLIPKNYDGPVPVEIGEAFRVLHAWGYVSPPP
jgi:hypothetical protein